jgi:uncharacterized protein YjbI with pentapeptide repeats
MKLSFFATVTLLSVVPLTTPAYAENLTHVQQLMTTRQCQGCDLSRAGLVLTNLDGVDLSGADLSLANLSRTNLSNANLRNANLTSAVLFSTNLSGADLSGADLRGADLREAYLVGANLEGANLEGANLLGAMGLPSRIATPEQLYLWGLTETRQGNFAGAIDYYNQALRLKPDFAHALLARGIARYRMGNEAGAIADGKAAEQLYLEQRDESGHRVSVQFYEGIEAMQEAVREGQSGGGGNFLNFLGGLTGLLMRMLL